MNQKKQLTVLICVGAGIAVFLLGAGFGALYQTFETGQGKKVQAVSSLSSKVVASITAYGTVTAIQGRTITLSNNGSSLTIAVAPSGVRIFAFAAAPQPGNSNVKSSSQPVQQTAAFSSIAVGDMVNVVMKLQPAGQLEASSIIILPKAAH